jgi:hypothetical protein
MLMVKDSGLVWTDVNSDSVPCRPRLCGVTFGSPALKWVDSFPWRRNVLEAELWLWGLGLCHLQCCWLPSQPSCSFRYRASSLRAVHRRQTGQCVARGSWRLRSTRLCDVTVKLSLFMLFLCRSLKFHVPVSKSRVLCTITTQVWCQLLVGNDQWNKQKHSTNCVSVCLSVLLLPALNNQPVT